MSDIYHHAMVTPDYSAEAAIADAKSAWKRLGGEQVDHYYSNWFADNVERVLMTSEYYSIR